MRRLLAAAENRPRPVFQLAIKTAAEERGLCRAEKFQVADDGCLCDGLPHFEPRLPVLAQVPHNAPEAGP